MILDDAYERFRVLPQHAITSESVVAETEGLELADYIFCPSPIVHSSLIKLGMPPSKLLLTSYGWDPIRLSRSTTQLPRADGLNALFVGTLNVRKGVHLLLHYWAQSGIKGKLTLAGEMDPIIKEKCADLLNRDDVVVRDFADDVGALYRSADVFLIPSLEEGSPLVTYEACGSRLPVVASPMGGGGIVRDKLEGLIIDPYDGPAWVAAIRTLAYDSELRMQMGQAAAKRAENFVWSSVTARRRDQIINLVKQRIEREESGLYMDLS
jgi:glycosyltransferase involved in cell wall biosynthesis